MRNLIIIILLAALNHACININKTIKVAYIIKTDSSQNESFLLDVKNTVKKEKYNVLFFEKLNYLTVHQLIKTLPDYDFYIGKPENGHKEEGIQPIAYKKGYFSIQTRAYLELNNPTTAPMHNGHNGHIVAVKLRETSSGRTFFALNAVTSEPHLNDQIYNIHKIIKSYTDNLPIILAGNFEATEQNIKLITGNWFNLVKLDGAASDMYGPENKKDGIHFFVNGFLNISKTAKERTLSSIQVSSSNISFNKNFRDVRTQSQLYPMNQLLPTFERSQIVFNNNLAIYISNPNPLARIVYTTDESAPSMHSQVYQHPIEIKESCRIKMRIIQKESEFGSIVCRYFVKTDIKNYHISKITYHPAVNTTTNDSNFLTDYMKGNESRTDKSWLPIDPDQSVSLKIDLEQNTEIKSIFLSFATPGKLTMPEITISTDSINTQQIQSDNRQYSMIGASLSQCGTEGWIKIDTKIMAQTIRLNLKPAHNSNLPIYIDEIVLQ